MHRIVRRLGDVSARRPWVTIAAWLVGLVVVLGLAAVAGGSFNDDLAAPGSQSERAQRLLEERFPDAAAGNAVAVFAVAESQRLDGHRDSVSRALAAVRAVDGVVSVSDPFAAGTVSPDGGIGYAAITFDTPALDVTPAQITAIGRALGPARADGLVAEVGGDAAFINAESQTSGAEAAGLLAALLVLVVAFGTVVAAFVPVLLALVGIAVGLGAVLLLANTLEVSTAAPTIGAMIGLGVGIDYALFIMARYRDNRAAGRANREALSDAMAAAGPAVLFAGSTVVVAMLALTLTGLGFLVSIGLATSLVVLVAVVTAFTLLPALLTLLGDRIDAGRLGRLGRLGRRGARTGASNGAWWRFAHRVAGRPWPYLVAGVLVLLTLAVPATRMQLGFPDAGNDATTTTHRRAYDLLSAGFGPGVNGPMLLVADLTVAGAGAADLPVLAGRIAADPGVASVGEPRLSPGGDAVVLVIVPTTAPADPATARTLGRVRALLPGNVSVAGITAMSDDLTAQLADTLPTFIGAILAASFLLLLLVFRSVLVPLKAAVMNLLSIAAAYGVVVAVFQWGWLHSLFGLDQTLPIVSPLPTIFFAVLFGLSMDYEVFLLSRVREEYDATGDPTESVARGMAVTGRVITSAALIMTVVFLSFVLDPSPLVKMIGVGLATAIVLDATVVRMILVPASMALLGRAAWWLPGRADRPARRTGTVTEQLAATGELVDDRAR